MTDLLKNATLFAGAAIVAIALADPAIATPLGVSEIAKTKELTVAEGTKNHGAIVSEAARQHGGGVSSLNSQGTSAASSSQSVPEPGTLLLLGTGFFSLVLCHRLRHRFST